MKFISILFNRYVNGKVDLDFTTFDNTIETVKAINDDEYIKKTVDLVDKSDIIYKPISDDTLKKLVHIKYNSYINNDKKNNQESNLKN